MALVLVYLSNYKIGLTWLRVPVPNICSELCRLVSACFCFVSRSFLLVLKLPQPLAILLLDLIAVFLLYPFGSSNLVFIFD